MAETAPPCDFPPSLALTSVCHMYHAYPRCLYDPHDNQYSGTLCERRNAAPYETHLLGREGVEPECTSDAEKGLTDMDTR